LKPRNAPAGVKCGDDVRRAARCHIGPAIFQQGKSSRGRDIHILYVGKAFEPQHLFREVLG